MAIIAFNLAEKKNFMILFLKNYLPKKLSEILVRFTGRRLPSVGVLLFIFWFPEDTNSRLVVKQLDTRPFKFTRYNNPKIRQFSWVYGARGGGGG